MMVGYDATLFVVVLLFIISTTLLIFRIEECKKLKEDLRILKEIKGVNKKWEKK